VSADGVGGFERAYVGMWMRAFEKCLGVTVLL
jgi:hypothetical protein